MENIHSHTLTHTHKQFPLSHKMNQQFNLFHHVAMKNGETMCHPGTKVADIVY